MKVRQKIASYGIALLSLTGALALAAPQSAVAADIDTCDLSKKVDELRGWDTNGQYNIIVWKDSARESARLNGVVVQGNVRALDCNNHVGVTSFYLWAIFRDGEFTQKGDGGYRNWAFYGRWTRNDRHVTFLPR
ncbi:hypothetical protein ACWEIJ_11040 [Lentzea sp. NPDC004789]